VILHTVSKSPFQHSALNDCLRIAREEDYLLLVEDGVYACVGNSQYAQQLESGKLSVYALEADVSARGLQNRISTCVELISYEQFVDLAARTRSTMSWY
jgi:tRNA 2-thiouridine synthesizing protein B